MSSSVPVRRGLVIQNCVVLLPRQVLLQEAFFPCPANKEAITNGIHYAQRWQLVVLEVPYLSVWIYFHSLLLDSQRNQSFPSPRSGLSNISPEGPLEGFGKSEGGLKF